MNAFGIDISRCGVYKITNISNGDCYIGSSINILRRWKKHIYLLNRQKHHSLHLQRAWNKYGESNYGIEPLIMCEPNELRKYEQYFIDNIMPKYNIAKDANEPLRGIKMTEERKKKISKATTGKKHILTMPYSDEHKNRISESLTGKKLSPEHCQAIGDSKRGNKYRRGSKLSDETREKLRLSHLGKSISEETKTKMSISQKANPNNSGRFITGSQGHLGHKHTEETKKKMSEATKQHYAKLRGEI